MGLAVQTAKYITVSDYLAGENDGAWRHEYVDGQVYAMAGASAAHNRIVGNVFRELSLHLRGQHCEAFINDMKVKVSASVFYYPDIFVACDPADDDPYFRQHPRLLIEVTSATTERIDRSEKLLAYKRIPSLQEYVLISQERIHIEIFRRAPDGSAQTWQWEAVTEPDELLELQSIGLQLNVADIYQRVKLLSPPPEAALLNLMTQETQ